MASFITRYFRNKQERIHMASRTPQFKSPDKMQSGIVLFDFEHTFPEAERMISAWAHKYGIRLTIVYFSSKTVQCNNADVFIGRKDISLLGIPSLEKVGPIIDSECDLLISAIESPSYPAEFVFKCSKAKFKIGLYHCKNHYLDLTVITAKDTESNLSKHIEFLLETLKRMSGNN